MRRKWERKAQKGMGKLGDKCDYQCWHLLPHSLSLPDTAMLPTAIGMWQGPHLLYLLLLISAPIQEFLTQHGFTNSRARVLIAQARTTTQGFAIFMFLLTGMPHNWEGRHVTTILDITHEAVYQGALLLLILSPFINKLSRVSLNPFC